MMGPPTWATIGRASPPQFEDFLPLTALTLAMFPVASAADIRNRGTRIWRKPVHDYASAHELAVELVQWRMADGNPAGVIYCAVKGPEYQWPWAHPGFGKNHEQGGYAVTTLNAKTIAHEIGHACTLEHPPGSDAPNPDLQYPAYEPYDSTGDPRGRLGEFGIDVGHPDYVWGAGDIDIMSYGSTQWISLYHYDKLIDNPILNPRRIVPRPQDVVDELRRRWGPVISIIGTITARGEVVVHHVARTEGVHRAVSGERHRFDG